MKDGVRSSSATVYLAPQYAQRPNLCVLLNTRVILLVANTWRVSKDGAETFEGGFRNETLMEKFFREWKEGGKRGRGPYGAGTFNQAGWFRVPDESLFGGIPDPAAGKLTAHFEFIIAVCVDLSI